MKIILRSFTVFGFSSLSDLLYEAKKSYFIFEIPCIISLYYIIQGGPKVGIQYMVYSIVLLYTTLCILLVTARVLLQLVINNTAKVASLWFFI